MRPAGSSRGHRGHQQDLIRAVSPSTAGRFETSLLTSAAGIRHQSETQVGRVEGNRLSKRLDVQTTSDDGLRE